MDYYSVTSSAEECRAAICLCGSSLCRGTFLHYSTREDLQQVLVRQYTPVYRFAALSSSCTEAPLRDDSGPLFARYGIKKYALRDDAPLWMRKYSVEILRFIEHERTSLPSALFRTNIRSAQPIADYTFQTADAEARSVMESRIQAMVITNSILMNILDNQPDDQKHKKPVRILPQTEAVRIVLDIMRSIPDLIQTHLLDASKKSTPQQKRGGSTPTQPADHATTLRKIQDANRRLKSILFNQKQPSTFVDLCKDILAAVGCLKPIVQYSTSTAR
jgi:hypothetical protein